MKELQPIYNIVNFKNDFFVQFEATRRSNPSLNKFLGEIDTHRSLFIVGGYLRNVVNNEEPRDLDIIINLKPDKLDDLITCTCKNFNRNRLGGYKIFFEQITVDAWSIENNWAFKKRLVTNVDTDYLKKIALGTFYNYDSLVLDIHTLQCNFQFYNDCAKSKELNIVKKRSIYKRLNPTKEANVLRAFYLKKKYDLNYSQQLYFYLKEQLEYINEVDGDRSKRLIYTFNKYQKYFDCLFEEQMHFYIEDVYKQLPKIEDDFNTTQLGLFD